VGRPAVLLPQNGLALSDAFASYGAVYKSQPWIAALVNKIAYGTARLPLKVYNREADGSRTEARDTPFAKLLRNPNPRHDPFFFWLWTVSTHEVYGEALWVKIRPRPGAAPTQLWPLHPANVVTIRRKVDGADYDGQLFYRYCTAPGRVPGVAGRGHRPLQDLQPRRPGPRAVPSGAAAADDPERGRGPSRGSCDVVERRPPVVRGVLDKGLTDTALSVWRRT
jgi:hypothetical protein